MVKTTDPKSHLWLHAKHLNISKSAIYRGEIAREGESSKESVELEKSFKYPARDFWVMEAREAIPPGVYTLAFRFTGRLKKGGKGFYVEEYRDSLGVTR